MQLDLKEEQYEVSWNEHEWYGTITISKEFKTMKEVMDFVSCNKHLPNLKLQHTERFNILGGK